MAKKIKFPLKLKDDFQVRTLEELKEHFDLDKVVAYFLDGKLLTWLKARYYEPEVKAVRSLRKNDPELQKKLCQIFGIEHSDYQLDINEVEERNRRLGILRQFTSDPTVLEQVASVAFNQEDLGDLLDDGVQKIFLCNNSFAIPLSIEDKTYIGIGKAIAVIRSTEKVDFDSKHISFQDISFDPDYQKLIDAEIIVPPAPQKDFYQLGLDAENSGDYNSAIDFYLKALEENNNADINFRLGWCYNKINDFVKAYSYYLKAANLGNTLAMHNIGCFYETGNGVDKDYSKALEFYTKAANLGNAGAMNNIGCFYEKGYGVNKDEFKALEFYTKAANLGNAEAMHNIGCFYEKGTGVVQDYIKALEWHTKAANLGNADSMYRIGLLSDDDDTLFTIDNIVNGNRNNYGNGVAKDHSKALEWYKKAANLGSAQAMILLGISYNYGKGVAKDYSKALEWYAKAANLGNADSMRRIGEFYDNGYGVAKNIYKAIEWYTKAANLGDTQSMCKMGRLYEFGSQIKQDIGKAITWYKKAANLGDVGGIEELEHMRRSIYGQLPEYRCYF